jgi:hypothetical protein
VPSVTNFEPVNLSLWHMVPICTSCHLRIPLFDTSAINSKFYKQCGHANIWGGDVTSFVYPKTLYIVTWRMKVGIVQPERTSIAGQRLGKRVPTAINNNSNTCENTNCSRWWSLVGWPQITKGSSFVDSLINWFVREFNDSVSSYSAFIILHSRKWRYSESSRKWSAS